MLANYLPVLVFLVIAAALGFVLLSLGFILGPRRPDAEKLSPYECGFEAFEDSRMKFDVRYYLVAILFIWRSRFSSRGRYRSMSSAPSAWWPWRCSWPCW